MAFLPRPVSPRAAWRDLRAMFAEKRKHKIVFAALSLALPALIVEGLYWQAKVDEEWVPPKIVYFEQWPANRSVADVRAQQAIDLPRERAARKAEADAALERRRAYARVAHQFGIKVDKVVP